MGTTAFLLALLYHRHCYRIGDYVQDGREDHSLAQHCASDPSTMSGHDRSDDPTTGRPTEAGDNFGPASLEKPVTPPPNAPGGDDDDD